MEGSRAFMDISTDSLEAVPRPPLVMREHSFPSPSANPVPQSAGRVSDYRFYRELSRVTLRLQVANVSFHTFSAWAKASLNKFKIDFQRMSDTVLQRCRSAATASQEREVQLHGTAQGLSQQIATLNDEIQGLKRRIGEQQVLLAKARDEIEDSKGCIRVMVRLKPLKEDPPAPLYRIINDTSTALQNGKSS